MNTIPITSHASLQVRINELKRERSTQEERLKYAFQAFAHTHSPLSIIKGSVKGLTQDKELRTDMVKAGLNLGTDFIIERLLGRSRSVKGFLSSILVENLSTPLINKWVNKLFRSTPVDNKQPADSDHSPVFPD